MSKVRLCLALDDPENPEQLIAELKGKIDVIKANSSYIEDRMEVEALAYDAELELWADLKLHDSPDTVRSSIRVLRRAEDVSYVTIHLLGCSPMINAALLAATEPYEEWPPITVIGVTLLTSIGSEELLNELGITETPREFALRLAKLGYACGVRHFVCSAQEVEFLRAELGPDVQLLTPGIRFVDADAGDQKRIGTPGEAARRGSDMLVMGNALVNGRAEAADRARREIEEALASA